MVLTKTIISSSSTSVASLKFLMSQNPNIAHCFLPGNIGLRSPYWAMFLAMISLPASPKPRANSTPILVMAFSINKVSLVFLPWVSWISYSFEERGLAAIWFTFLIILSIGLKAKSFISLLKYILPHVSTIDTNMVLRIPKTASSSLTEVISTILLI